jgi:alkylation response protein AidB-like acyl-CoA dehydrogenase
VDWRSPPRDGAPRAGAGPSGVTPAPIVATAARLARERLARAALRPEAANPVELERPARRGLVAAAVPAAHGGLGLDMPTYVEVIRARWPRAAATPR